MNTTLKRSISGLVYLVVLIACILWCKYSFLAVMLFFCACMQHEFMSMTMGRKYIWSQILAIFAGLSFFSLVWAVRAFETVTAEYILLSLIPLIVVMVNSLYVRDKSDFGKFANVYTSLLYIAIPMSILSFLVMDTSGNYNGLLLLCFFCIIWCSDIGAYVFGIAFGQKHGKKLFPSISPKKSWIGFWGGLAVAVAASVTMYFTGLWQEAGLKGITCIHAIVLSVAMNVTGVYGDLFESQWKRHYSIKDSGRLIPGHGGMLDRMDSSLFAIPSGVIYLSIFNLYTAI